MNEKLRKHLYRAVRATSFVLILKGGVAGSVAVLALFGVTVPVFGVELTPTNEGAAAGIGAIIGMLAAIKG